MKKVLVLLAIFAMTSLSAFATGGTFNPNVDQYATFTGTVIAPLEWGNVSSAAITLPTGIAGQYRTTGFTEANSKIYFPLQGEAGKSVILTNHFALTSGGTGTVTLDYNWLYPSGSTQVLTGGQLIQEFSVTGIDASADAHGVYVWTVSVDAVYTGI